MRRVVSIIAAATGVLVASGCGRISFEEHAQDVSGADGGSLAQPGAVETLVVGVEGDSASWMLQLSYDPVERTVTQSLPALRLDAIEGSRLRSVVAAGDKAFAGGGSVIAGVEVEAWIASDSYAVQGQLGGVHGMCRLPSGRWVLGDSGPNAGNRVAEFQVVSGRFEQMREVYATTIDSGSLSSCFADESSELFMVEWAAYTDEDGDLLRLELQNGQWVEAARFDTSSFAVGTYGDDHRTSLYSFALHPSGSLYLFPQRRFDRRVRGLIRCPRDFSDQADCDELGALPGDAPGKNGPGAIQGAAVEADGSGILFASNSALYRYDLAGDSWQQLFDIGSALDADQVSQVRDIRLLP